MKPRKPTETDAEYIKRLEAANFDLRRQGKWAQRVGRAITWLACDASLAFQAMAEKAGIRSHPSVTAAVEAFSTIAHPQWAEEGAEVHFPTDWDIQPCEGWSGDADMELNSGIAAVLEYLEARKIASGVKIEEMEHIANLQKGLEQPLQGIVGNLLHGEVQRTPIEIPDNADRTALVQTINDISWRALDLAQDMASANQFLRRDLRAATYRMVCGELYDMSRLYVPEHNPNFDVRVIGGAEAF